MTAGVPRVTSGRGPCRECGKDSALVWSKAHETFVIRAHGYTNEPYGTAYCPGAGDRERGKPSIHLPTRAGRAGDQPLPTVNHHPFVQDQLKDYIERRKQLGIERYGTALQPHNGRDALRDALEEAVDLAVYLSQLIIERDGHLP